MRVCCGRRWPVSAGIRESAGCWAGWDFVRRGQRCLERLQRRQGGDQGRVSVARLGDQWAGEGVTPMGEGGARLAAHDASSIISVQGAAGWAVLLLTAAKAGRHQMYLYWVLFSRPCRAKNKLLSIVDVHWCHERAMVPSLLDCRPSLCQSS